MAQHTGRLTAVDDPPAVRTRYLRRAFDGAPVLDGIDLDIAGGEFVALLGPSGSGKSTLLRALAGLDHDIGGSGQLDVPADRAVVFQDARLLPWARVLDNVVLGLRGDDARERGRELLQQVGLQDRERSWPGSLSGGQAQRAALARSLVRRPALLLADEPFGALDALTRIRMHALLRELRAEHRPAVLLVTHDVDEAISLADRVLVLDAGRITTDRGVRPGSNRAEHRRELLAALGVDEERGVEAGGAAARERGAGGGQHREPTSPAAGRAEVTANTGGRYRWPSGPCTSTPS